MNRARPYIVGLAVAAALAAGRDAHAQGASTAGLDSATVAAISPIIEQARAARLPVDLLYAKARQGQVQHLPVAKIEAAVRVVAERIQIASEALAPSPTVQELSAAADALQRGVPRETLREMRPAGDPDYPRGARGFGGKGIGAGRRPVTAWCRTQAFHRARRSGACGCARR